jgi:hypothetical protein
MTAPPRREVHETRVERALSLPARLPDVAELLDVVRGELVADGRPPADATLRIAGDALIAAYVQPEQQPTRIQTGFQA